MQKISIEKICAFQIKKKFIYELIMRVEIS